MSNEDEEEASDNHLALLALLLPIILRFRVRIAELWETPGEIGIGDFANAELIAQVKTIILENLEVFTPDIEEEVNKIDEVLKQQVKRARIILFDASSKEDALKAADVLEKGVDKVEAINEHVEVKSGNTATSNSRDSNEEVIWDAERNACVRCLAYAGKVMDSNGSFDGKNKFGAPSVSVGLPPLHPHCRCKVRKVRKDNVEDVSTAMEREAERSIMRGFSLPSESNSARIRATRTLLNRGSSLPASVQAYGRKSINKGEYPRGRDVP